MDIRCPGAKLMRQPEPELFLCPSCGWEVEIWTDEIRRACPRCGKVVTRLSEMSCIEWCKMARECIGESQFTRYMADRVRTWKSRLLEKVEEQFGSDSRKVEHTREALRYAEEIMSEEGGDPHIVIPAVTLYDIGISGDDKNNEKTGAELSRKILLKEGFQMEHVDEICDIFSHHRANSSGESLNWKIVQDARMLVKLKEADGRLDAKNPEEQIEGLLLTPAGRILERRFRERGVNSE